MQKLFVLSIILLVFASCKPQDQVIAQTPKTKFKMEKTTNHHLVLAQYHRWFQLYERPVTPQRLQLQTEILTDDIHIKSVSGEVTGKKNYTQYVNNLPQAKNAHYVKEAMIKKQEDGTLTLETLVHYQNIQPDGKQQSFSLKYNNQLQKSGALLPVFSTISITPDGNLEDSFTDAYPENRAKSLMHYWLSLIEQVDGNSTPFKELLADNFTLNFSSGQLTTLAQFDKWIKGAPAQLKQSSHYAKNFSIKVLNENAYEMSVEFDWYGITKDDKKMTARTQHRWVIEDNVNERFAKVKQMDVQQLKPFTVVEE